MNKKDGKLIKLLHSVPEQIINKRFLVKTSVFNNGVNKESIVVCVRDLLESGFTIKFFNSEDDAAKLLKLLHAV